MKSITDPENGTTLSLVTIPHVERYTYILATVYMELFVFIGRDASLAFITGEFEEELTDDISNLSARQVKTLDDWLQFYNTNYIYKGTII